MNDFQERLRKIEERDRLKAVVRNYLVLIAMGVAVFIYG